MNPIFREASQLATGGLLMGLVTIAFFAFFTAVALRLLRPSARLVYADLARLPLDDSDGPVPSDARERTHG